MLERKAKGSLLNSTKTDIYDPVFVTHMFNNMSKTYGLANLISSFGFTAIWRRQCVAQLPVGSGKAQVFDLMSGMGETWKHIKRQLGPETRIIGIDISEEMNKKAAQQIRRLNLEYTEIIQTNILKNDLPDASADYVVSSFGLKTFNKDQQKTLASEISRVLKPGGSFSLIEISVPEGFWIKWPYFFYLKVIIPLIGWLFLGNSKDYSMLGTYCSTFGNSRQFSHYLKEVGLTSSYKNYFMGCASGVYGSKSATPEQK